MVAQTAIGAGLGIPLGLAVLGLSLLLWREKRKLKKAEKENQYVQRHYASMKDGWGSLPSEHYAQRHPAASTPIEIGGGDPNELDGRMDPREMPESFALDKTSTWRQKG